jgi:DNA repair protein RadA/Sms
MAKSKQIYLCNECAAEYSQWFGLCKECNEFGTISEEPVEVSSGGLHGRGGWQSSIHSGNKASSPAKARVSLKFSEINNDVQQRFPSGYGELDRVLGGGIVPGCR